MRKVIALCVAVLTLAVAGTAAELSGEWSTRVGFGFGASVPSYSTTVAFHTTLDAWDVSSTSVLTGEGLSTQSFTFARDLGWLALSGGIALAPTSDGLTATRGTTDTGLGWTAAGLELAAWDLSLKLDLGTFTLKVTVVR